MSDSLYTNIRYDLRKYRRLMRFSKIFGMIFLIIGALLMINSIFLFLFYYFANLPSFYCLYIALPVFIFGLIVNIVGVVLFILRNTVFQNRMNSACGKKALYERTDKFDDELRDEADKLY